MAVKIEIEKGRRRERVSNGHSQMASIWRSHPLYGTDENEHGKDTLYGVETPFRLKDSRAKA